MKKNIIYLILMIIIATSVISTSHSVTLGSTTIATSTGINPYSIIINNPQPNATIAGNLIIDFQVISLDGGITCDLLVNGIIVNTNNSIQHATPTQLIYTPLTVGTKTWQLQCGGNGITGNITTTLETFQTAPTILTVNVKNIQTQTHLTNVTLTVQGINTTTYNGTSPFIIGPNPGTYNITATQPPYFPETKTIIITTGLPQTLNFNLGFNASFNLFDERTLNPFNISSPDRTTFQIFCPTSTIITEINTTNFTIPITCQYSKFRFVLDYGPTNYYRTFILNPDQTLGVNVYLIDLATTTAIFNNFIIDDLLRQYDNIRVFIKKIIINKTEQITADYTDIESSIGAFLIENNEYIIEIHSDNQPDRILGPYLADTAGDKTLRLYDISLNISGQTPIQAETLTYSSTQQTINGTPSYILKYKDKNNATNSVFVQLRTGSINGPLIYSNIITSQNFEDITNITQYQNDTIYSIVTIDNQQYGTILYNTLINEISKIKLDLIGLEINQNLITWLITIIISVIAIMATYKSGNVVAIAVLGIAIIFNIIGWFPISKIILGLGTLLTIIYLLKKGDKDST